MNFCFFVEISLPASHKDESEVVEAETKYSHQIMHIGGFNFLQQNKTTVASGTGENTSEQVVSATGVLKEFNKNTTSSDNYKANKKYKYGHVNKSFEQSSSAYGKCVHSVAV
jgi:hypothetical protein